MSFTKKIVEVRITLTSGIYAGKIAAEKAIEKVIDNLT